MVGALASLTLLLIVVNLPDGIPVLLEGRLEPEVYLLLTAFALALSVPLVYTELSLAHAIGMTAFLSLEERFYPAMTLAMAVGGILGGIARVYRNRGRENRAANIRTVIYLTAQVTLSFYVAARTFVAFPGAILPLPTPTSENWLRLLLPLLVYTLLYLTVYFAIFTLQQYTESRNWRILARESGLTIVVLLLLPVPFAIIAADVARANESFIFFTITATGTALAIFAFYVLSTVAQKQRRQLAEMHTLSAVTDALRGSLNLDALLRTLYVQMSQAFQIDDFVVALQADSHSPLQYPLVVRQGTTQSTGQLPIDAPLIQQVLQTKQPLLVSDTAAIPFGTSLPAQVTSWLGVPLLSGTASIGALAVFSQDNRRHFTPDDVRLLNIIAASASIAIENARLYTRNSLRAEQLSTLNQVSRLLTGTLSPQEVLDTLVSSASTVSDAQAVAVYLLVKYDAKSVLHLVGSAGLSNAFTLAEHEPLLMAEIVTGQRLSPLTVRDVAQDERAAPLRALLAKEKIQALIELPLVIGDTLFGVVALFFDQVQPALHEQLDLLQAYATQAAQAIKNARTYDIADKALEQRVEQLYALAALGRVLNASLETGQVYEVMLKYALDSTRAARGVVALKNDTGLWIAAQQHYPPETLRDSALLEQGIPGRVLKSGQPMHVDDVRTETGYLPLVPRTRSLLVVPVLKARDVLGLILLESDEAAAFSESDTQFVAQMAYQAVVAADNTRLFQSVRETRDNLQEILNTMEEGLILIDANLNIALANPRVDLPGFQPEHLVGRAVRDLLLDEKLAFATRTGFVGVESVRRLLEQIQQPGEWRAYAPHNYEISDEQGRLRYIQRQIFPLRDDREHIIGALLVFYNRTDERELARAQENVTQMLVHDLRSPLTAVTTSLRLLQQLVPAESDYKPIVEKTTEVSRRAIRKVLMRVDSLLDVAKMESGDIYLDRQPTDVRTIVETVRTELMPLANEMHVTMLTDLAPELPVLQVDADKVERMLLNLVDNALKYTPENGTITIRARMDDAAGWMQLAVADEGPGIPDDYKQRLFDRFVQVSGRQGTRRGVGLGLAFCQLVTKAHGGRIWIEDNQPRGTVFIATLPIVTVSQGENQILK
jgi:K+-sensing histidine kinase KdpD